MSPMDRDINLETLEDQELARMAGQNSDPAAFEELMRRHHGRLYGALGRMVRDREKVEDLCQETFLRAWRGLKSFSGEAAFYTWLYRIGRNLVASEFRREQARPKLKISLDQPFEDGSTIDPADRIAVAPDREALAQERQAAVARAITDLGPDFREIIVLRDLECRPYEEIADLLELPVGTVRSRLHRARMELKDRLKDFFS